MGIALLMASCTDDYTDWADPIKNGPEDPIGVGITVTPAAAIDFATTTAETVQLFNASITGAESGADVVYGAEITNEDGSKSIELELIDNFYVNKDELESAVYSLWGRRPVARTIPVNVVGLVEVGKMVVAAKASTTLTATPNAPVIEDAYYYVGTVNGWSDSDKTYKLTNGGGDVYDNPVFTILIPAPTGDGAERVENWFKIAPESAYTSDNFWANLWGVATNGDVSTSGKLVYGDVGAFCQPATDGAKFYRININMLDETYEIIPLSFAEFIYVPGNGQGWNPGSAAALRSPNFDGVYTGYVYLDGGFKFTKARNWDAEYNWNDLSSVPSFLNNGAGTDTNLYCDDPGVYYLTVDVASGKITGEKINNMNLVGDFNGWNNSDDAMQMTWDAENLCYTITGAAVTTNGWKFTANNGWDINLGSNDTVEPSTVISDLVGGGKNIGVAGSTIKLYPCRTTSDKIYCTVE